jgi:ribulose-5-phosphate 4-epimerase/fuculose-1-phosphate aldolase
MRLSVNMKYEGRGRKRSENNPISRSAREVEEIRRTAIDLENRGWARSFFGNISVLMKKDLSDLDIINTYEPPVDTSSLAGSSILITRASSTMRSVHDDPAGNLGLYRIDKELYLIRGTGPPSSEVASHLIPYIMGRGEAIIHCHMDVIDIATDLFGGGGPDIEFPWIGILEPGSVELAVRTGEEMGKRRTVVWAGHGAISCARDLRDALSDLISLERTLRDLVGSS